MIRELQRYDDKDFISGDDQIDSGAGDDIVHGQRGDDQILGGSGDDELFGELGVDQIQGEAGNDIILADVGRIVRDVYDDGLPRLNGSGSWHRDVFLESVGSVIGSIQIDTTPLRTLDSDLASKLLEADLMMVAGTFSSTGRRY